MIKVYVLSSCQRCEELKSYMKRKSIKFNEIDVEKNPRALAKMTIEGIDKYPVIEIDGRLYSGEVNDLKRMF